MSIRKRVQLLAGAAVLLIGPLSIAPARIVPAASAAETPPAVYGSIGKMTAQPGQRDALIRILMEAAAGMPGCLSYVVAKDRSDPDLVWVTEVWKDKEAHDAALSLPSVRAAISRGRPLIAVMSAVAETAPVGGLGVAGK